MLVIIFFGLHAIEAIETEQAAAASFPSPSWSPGGKILALSQIDS